MPDLRLTQGTLVTSVINKKQVRFFVQNSEDHIQACHLSGKFYEEEELAIISKYVTPGSYFADIGANIGNHTIYAALYLDVAKVIPFEVNPAALHILTTNISLNQLKNVETKFLGVGIGGQDSRLTMTTWADNNWGGTVYRTVKIGKVAAVAGDSLLAGEPIKFIKMDIEGMEIEALRGLAVTIKRWRPNMFIECQDSQFAEFQALMEAYQYAIVETFARYKGLGNFMVVPIETLHPV